MSGVLVRMAPADRAFAEAGYRVVVPDQRGYNRDEKPDGLEAYNLDELAGDVVGVIEAAGRDTAVVVSHDWVATVAWWLASALPARVDRLVTINVPPQLYDMHAGEIPIDI